MKNKNLGILAQLMAGVAFRFADQSFGFKQQVGEQKMKRQSFHRHINAMIVSMALGLLMIAQSFAATGGSFYASQLSSITAGDTSYGSYPGGSPSGYTLQLPLTQAIDLQAGNWYNSVAVVQTSVNQPSFMEWDLPSGTFNAKTVIAYRNTAYPFETGSPWHLELFNSVTSAWQPIGVSGTGAPSDSTLAMANTGITGTKIRAVYDSLNLLNSTGYMSMGEILVLPDHLHKVTNSYTASASSSYNANYLPANGIDNQESSSSPIRAWFSYPYAPEGSHPWYTLSFTSPTTLNALLLSKWDNNGDDYTDAFVDIYVNGTLAGGWTDGTLVAGGVDMASPLSFSSFNVFKFDSTLEGVNSLSLKFTNDGRTSDGGQGLAEIIPFVVPEPTAAMLLGLGGVLLLRSRRKKS